MGGRDLHSVCCSNRQHRPSLEHDNVLEVQCRKGECLTDAVQLIGKESILYRGS